MNIVLQYSKWENGYIAADKWNCCVKFHLFLILMRLDRLKGGHRMDINRLANIVPNLIALLMLA